MVVVIGFDQNKEMQSTKMSWNATPIVSIIDKCCNDVVSKVVDWWNILMTPVDAGDAKNWLMLDETIISLCHIINSANIKWGEGMHIEMHDLGHLSDG